MRGEWAGGHWETRYALGLGCSTCIVVCQCAYRLLGCKFPSCVVMRPACESLGARARCACESLGAGRDVRVKVLMHTKWGARKHGLKACRSACTPSIITG